ncbi:hypothetical protein NW754_004730 [Fusarium falciforme]|uniref:CsbD-like domain-containing protein n=1 Tax=Fusarium falciforme TaxID=195108 RepID=A0A9W8V1E7_9HYPO|nr:Hypothetical protein NCS54_00775200 [Fusarium falciforme]KAJ4174314.1 hypothetical protein NW754_004730 [Fusarium falciforme]KAJ4186901.1 hypothetical protein NW755_007634 [Fusarium falciforme]KAJ4208426.1 hypothetical protein NW767_001531 [Fusarium falciforme]KAJ4257853.1 hypothetical protein NW757_003480 [Fusarium falciforme]WAO90328.1 Hypothetical protein NCS54_00775200 [Fusarium falciforme]
MSDNNNQQQQQQPQGSQPGLIGSHYQYAKGAAEATVGVLTGSHAWKASGEQDKAAGLAALKKVGEMREQQDPNHEHGYGRAEEIAGKVTGCQGMEREGHASAHKKQ